MARKQPTADEQIEQLARGCRSVTVDGQPWTPAPKTSGRERLKTDATAAERIAARPPTGCEIVVTMKAKTRGPNSREHWAERAKRVADEQLELSLLLAAHTMKREHLVPGCVVRLCRIGKRVDDDNLRGYLKAIRDGVAAFLLGGRMGERDDDERITWEYDQQYLGPTAHGVVVSISPRT